MEKRCTKCSVVKSLDQFQFRNKAKNIKKERCKTCSNEYTLHHHQNNRELVNKSQKIWYENKGRDWRKDYNSKNRERINEKSRLRWKTDENFRLRKVLSARFKQMMKGMKKSKSSLKYVGMDIPLVLKWLESQFDNNMSWENQGSYWDIDHVKPCASFDLTDEKEVLQCFHWTNIQPLEKRENYSKNNKVLPVMIREHRVKAIDFSKLNQGANVDWKLSTGAEKQTAV